MNKLLIALLIPFSISSMSYIPSPKTIAKTAVNVGCYSLATTSMIAAPSLSPAAFAKCIALSVAMEAATSEDKAKEQK